jgi:F-type H+-transporting ATPase subunit alpha
MSAENEIMILFAGAYGYLDQWPVQSVAKYEKEMLEFMSGRHTEILKEIREKANISPELEEKMKKALDEFKGVFQP